MPTATVSRKSTDTTAIEATEIPDAATETAKPMYEFKILYENVTLGTTQSLTPAGKTITGDVAQLSDGRRVARVSYPDGFAYADFASDPRLSNGFTGSSPGWPAKFKNEIEILSVLNGSVRTLSPTSIMAECADIKARWPGVFALLGLEKDRPAPLFSAGSVTYSIKSIVPISELHTYLDFHMSGSWGLHGAIDFRPLSEEELWCVDMLSINRRNSASVLTGSGIVVSSFPLSPELQARHRKEANIPDWRDNPVVLTVWSLLHGGSATSVIRRIGLSEA